MKKFIKNTANSIRAKASALPPPAAPVRATSTPPSRS